MPSLSVIIPTHRRAGILKECLRHLKAQTIADELEIVVVSDGPDQETSSMLHGEDAQFLEIEKSQQGVARNKGVTKADAPYCLFIGDDIFLAPDACEKHLHALQDHGSAVLGFTTWDPLCGITPVMQWLEQSGWQFGYPLIEKYAHNFIPSGIQHSFSYTSHISLPTELALAHPFLTDVRLYGWEDMEWGMRLADAGVKLFYERDAKALHHHHITLEQSLKRMRTLGESAVDVETRNPALSIVPRGIKRIAYRFATALPGLSGEHRKAFLQGIELAERQKTR